MTDPNAFTADVRWKRADAKAELSLCAYSFGLIWMSVTETPPRERRTMLARLLQDGDSWIIAQEADGPACFDITGPGRNFGRLPSIPFVVENSLDEVRGKIDECMDLLREKGIERCRRRFSNRIAALQQTIEAGKASIAERTEKLESEVRAIDPNARLIHIGADPRPFIVREVIETGIGPLVLEIKDADRFTLSSPRALASHDSSLLRDAQWKDGAWTGLPYDNDHAEIVRALGLEILSKHARDMRDASWSKIAKAKHELELDQQALDVLMHKTLPGVLAESDAFEASMTETPAPRA